MDSFNYFSPTEFVFGEDRENEVGKLAKKYGATKMLHRLSCEIRSYSESHRFS